jgi:hypothetical protein
LASRLALCARVPLDFSLVLLLASGTSMQSMAARFPIRFDRWYRALSTALLLRPSSSYVEVTDDHVEARMGWGFRTQFPLAAVAKTAVFEGRTLSRGVHGWAGRWLVNGSGAGIVIMYLEPTQQARVMGCPVRLRELMVSVDDPGSLRKALSRGRE